jgi:hypothetical protein
VLEASLVAWMSFMRHMGKKIAIFDRRTLDPDPYPDPDSLEMMDPDPKSMNQDPQHWLAQCRQWEA